MGIKNFRVTEVKETDYGVYVWEMPDGAIVGDDEGNFLSVQSKRGDILNMKALTEAVRSFGINEGQAKFLPGRRKVTDSEWEDQMERMQQGQVPDPYDLGNIPGQV